MPIRKHYIFVDDALIVQQIPRMKRISNRLVYTGADGKPIKTRHGTYLLSWSVAHQVPQERLPPMRPMTQEEVVAIAKAMAGTYAIRDRAWFILGTYCGLRSSQLSTLTVDDVSEYGGIRASFTVPALRRPKHPERPEKTMHPAAAPPLLCPRVPP